MPDVENVQKLYDTYASALIKYHLPIKSKIKVSLATGWTLLNRRLDYYDYYTTSNSSNLSPNIYSYSTFGIPLLIESSYPIWNTLSAGIRVKHNFNNTELSTYSVAASLSLSL